ncbi:MAG TPA: hypothetical protein VMX17_07570 [Candidatus Glassbacteria bacterium]|nr:hypothetical protein [Candidatus Glassbacteria bacterium]
MTEAGKKGTDENESAELTNSQKRQIRWEERALKRKEREQKREERGKGHPLNILRGFGMFFVYLFKIIFFPYIYAWWKTRDTFKFLLVNDKEELDRDLLAEEDGDVIPNGYLDEKGFLRSLPMFYFVAGTLGGIVAIFISFDFMDPVWNWFSYLFEHFTWALAWQYFLQILEWIFVDGIWAAMRWIGLGIYNILVYLGNSIFGGRAFWVPLVILISIGVAIIIIAVILSEIEFTGKFMKKFKEIMKAIFTFPKTLGKWIKKGYIAFQNFIAKLAFGPNKLKFFAKRFFYRVVIYSTVITLWIIASVFILVMYTEFSTTIDVHHQLVYPIGLVLIGFVNGIALLAFLSWFVGLLSGKRYIIDQEGYEKAKEERNTARQERRKKKAKPN